MKICSRCGLWKTMDSNDKVCSVCWEELLIFRVILSLFIVLVMLGIYVAYRQKRVVQSSTKNVYYITNFVEK